MVDNSGFLYPSDNGEYAVEITMGKDGGLEIQTSMVSENQEYLTLWQTIASEILSIDPSLVVLAADSDDEGPLDLPDSGPATLSRNISCITQLVERCCIDIRKQRFRDPLPITVRRSWQSVRAMNWDNRNIDTNVFANMGWGAAIVEVCVDRVSYTPQIRGIWLTIDGGRLLSEKNARSELMTSSIQALGWACWEDLDYEAGEISDFAIRHYQVPALPEIPPIHIEFINTDDTVSRGLGELPFNIIPAAYVQAVSQAMNHPFDRIPLRPRDIWAAEEEGL
ncbi:hypothetical protein FACS1894200_14300 [Spirochaetia bacterium]|nr:hypothetical protein FACS1894200_14300 [Spirochaetia bacterium]